jgi:hypothetical protein
MYCIVRTSHVCCVIVYQQFHNYDVVIFLYCHISDSNYRLPIDTKMFFSSDLSIFDGPNFTDRIPFPTFPFSFPTE